MNTRCELNIHTVVVVVVVAVEVVVVVIVGAVKISLKNIKQQKT